MAPGLDNGQSLAVNSTQPGHCCWGPTLQVPPLALLVSMWLSRARACLVRHLLPTASVVWGPCLCCRAGEDRVSGTLVAPGPPGVAVPCTSQIWATPGAVHSLTQTCKMKKPMPHTSESRECAQGYMFISATEEAKNTTSTQAPLQ